MVNIWESLEHRLQRDGEGGGGWCVDENIINNRPGVARGVLQTPFLIN